MGRGTGRMGAAEGQQQYRITAVAAMSTLNVNDADAPAKRQRPPG